MKRLKNNLAQSVIEYTVIATLVMAGIFIIGPYIIRSFNAHLKGYEDSVVDAQNDPLLQGSPDDISVPGQCDCAPFTDQGCGSPGGCPRKEMHKERVCFPPGCETTINPPIDTDICEEACGCCEDYLDDVNGCGGSGPMATCLPTEMHQTAQCGLGCTRDRCDPLNDICRRICEPPGGQPDFSAVCVDSVGISDDTNLSSSGINWRLVTDASSCTDAVECEAYCNAGLTPIDTDSPPDGIFDECGCPQPYALDLSTGTCFCPPSAVTTESFECQCAASSCGDGGYAAFGCSRDCPLTRSSIVYASRRCNSAYEFLVGGRCEFQVGVGGSTYSGSSYYLDAPTSDGLGWQCAGITRSASGSTCHLRSLHVFVSCLPSCNAAPPAPAFVPVYAEPVGCGSDLTLLTSCVREVCSTSPLRTRNCNTGICEDGGGTCPTTLIGRLSAPSGFNVYMEGCGFVLFTNPAVNLRPDTASACEEYLIGYLDPSLIVPGSTPIYTQSGAPCSAGGQYTASASCTTDSCGFGRYLNCAGACRISGTPFTCPNTLAGYLRPP